MRHLLIIIFAFNFIGHLNKVNAQSPIGAEKRLLKIREHFTEKDNRKLSKSIIKVRKADSLVNEAEKLDLKINEHISKADMAVKNKDKRQNKRAAKKKGEDARDIRINATQVYEDALNELYFIYKENLIAMKTNNESLDEPVAELMTQAKGSFAAAQAQLNKLIRRDHYFHVRKELIEIHEFKKQGLQKLLDAFCIYIDCTETVVVEEEEEATTEEIVIATEPIVIATEPIVETPKETHKPEFVATTAPDEIHDVTYEVQIIAMSRPLSVTEISELYWGRRDVILVEEAGLFKYRIGEFTEYARAKNYLGILGIEDAFIIGFDAGQRIDIEDAIEWSK